MSNIINVTDDTFEAEVLTTDTPVLVDFWAEWCGPCKQIAPTLDKLATEYAGKVKFVKVNVDQASGIAAQHGIRSIPTLKLFKGGEDIDTKVGALSEPQLKEFIDPHI